MLISACQFFSLPPSAGISMTAAWKTTPFWSGAVALCGILAVSVKSSQLERDLGEGLGDARRGGTRCGGARCERLPERSLGAGLGDARSDGARCGGARCERLLERRHGAVTAEANHWGREALERERCGAAPSQSASQCLSV
mmetsp:Transcript_20693/g.57191  ORF Transcript_20693/g.57191 Transcript_20693/m.57191 type:complete len:141 (-) Transcript_20693:529-951(-)